MRTKEQKEKFKKWRKDYFKRCPWLKTATHIYNRCKGSNPISKSYKSIKILITSSELKELWFRDKAYLMQRPSIDRINSKGNYELKNCRYIELSENIRLGNFDRSVAVRQLALDGKLIKVWHKMGDAARILNIDQSTISHVCKGEGKTAGGYNWKYI